MVCYCIKATNSFLPVWSCFLNKGLDKWLKKEIQGYLSEGIMNIRTIQILLKHYVQKNIGRHVPASARYFYLTGRITYNYLLKHTYQSRISKIDQVSLRAGWEIAVEGKFYLREYVEGESTFMFCYVSETQEHLMIRSGEISLLDPTYKKKKICANFFY